MTALTKHICDRFHLNALTCSLSQPGNDHVLVTESEPAMTHSESLWKGFNVCVFVSFKTIQLHELHSSCGGLRLWWGERDFFFFFFFFTFTCIHKHNGLNQYWYGSVGCSAHHIGRVNIATVIRKKQKGQPACMMWGVIFLTTAPENSHRHWDKIHTTQGNSAEMMSG